MKTYIAAVTLLSFSGLVLAESDMSVHKKDVSSQQGQYYTQQRTAQQPGIGDSTNQFERKASVDDFFERDDWSIITEEDIYGSF